MNYRIKPYRKRSKNDDEKHGTPAKMMVDNILAKLGFDPAMYAIFEVWDRETKGLIKGCEAVAIQGTKICVRVPSVVHRQELHYSKKRIISRLNQALGRNAITDIQFELPKGS
jgi:hypothetical protein